LPNALDRRRTYAGVVLIAAALIAAPFLVGATLGNAWVRILDFAALYIMLALGLNIVVGFAGLLDLGYIAFYAVGAYLYALLASPQFGLHWPVWAILPLGALVAGIFGVLLGTPTLRLRGDYLAIVTLGFGEIIRIFLNNLNAPVNITNGPQGITRVDPITIAGHPLTHAIDIAGFHIGGLYLHYFLFVLLALGVVFVTVRLQDSRIGRAWVAIREDEIAAKACGINTRNIKLLAFAMGASFGFQEFVSPESFSLMESVMVLCMVVLGGMGHIPGVILGGLMLSVLPEAFRHGAGPLQQVLFDKVMLDPEALRMLLFGLALIAVMLYRPAGLWPDPRHRRELAE